MFLFFGGILGTWEGKQRNKKTDMRLKERGNLGRINRRICGKVYLLSTVSLVVRGNMVEVSKWLSGKIQEWNELVNESRRCSTC